MPHKYWNKTAQADYLIRVCIRYKHVRDTIKTCNRQHQAWGPYVHGQIEPHFQVPALRTHVYMDDGVVYIKTNSRLRVFWRGDRNEADSYLY